MQPDFPDPVVPAISKCGIEVRSPMIGVPEILFPKAIGNFKSRLLNFSLEIISLRKTLSLFSLVIPNRVFRFTFSISTFTILPKYYLFP